MKETKRIIKSHDFRVRKRYSQNFVIEPKLIEWLLQYSDLTENDTVVEIGAGLGTLTKSLAENAKKVIAVEIDPKLVEVLHKELESYSNVDIIQEDILELKSTVFEGKKIISNIPYKISSPLTFKILPTAYSLAVLSYQKEFANRMTSAPGMKSYGRLTLGVNYYAHVEYLKSIPMNFFHPAPKVESALVRLTPHKPPIILNDEKDFFEFVRHLFSFRNKTVRRAVKLYLKHNRKERRISTDFQELFHSDKRIFNLSIQQFHELYLLIQEKQDDSI